MGRNYIGMDDTRFYDFDYYFDDIGIDYDPHDTICLFYDVGVNGFIDNYGRVILDIHRLLTPWQLMLFKRRKEDMVFPDVTNSFLIELVYPDPIYGG